MAARERETAVVVGAAGAKPSELRGGSSAFRRTADFYEERQIPGPRRFGFGGSPPRRNHYDQQSQQRPSPPRSTNHHQDTPRQTILPSSRGSPSSPSIGSRASLLSPPRPIIGTASNDVRALLNDTNGGGQTDEGVDDGLQTASSTAHPVFSQLAAVLGFELAKKVTARHPRETDLNRLANLALDITTAPGLPLTALESGAAVTSAPSRSASTTSATSTHSEQRSAARRGLGGGGGHFNRPSGNRSPLDEQRGRYGGGGGRSVRSSLGSAAGRTRANSTPLAAAAAAATAAGATDDSFVTAVSAASAAASSASIPRSPAPSSSPRPHTVVSDETTTDVRTDNTAMDDNEEDLIDWDGETAAPPEEEEHNQAVPSAHSTIDCAPHLLD